MLKALKFHFSSTDFLSHKARVLIERSTQLVLSEEFHPPHRMEELDSKASGDRAAGIPPTEPGMLPASHRESRDLGSSLSVLPRGLFILININTATVFQVTLLQQTEEKIFMSAILLSVLPNSSPNTEVQAGAI